MEVIASVRAVPHESATKEVYSLLRSHSGAALAQAMESSCSLSFPSLDYAAKEALEVIVAVQQGNILATAFHPELTQDIRWHRYFVDMVLKFQEKA